MDGNWILAQAGPLTGLGDIDTSLLSASELANLNTSEAKRVAAEDAARKAVELAKNPQARIEEWYHSAMTFLTEQGLNFAFKLIASIAIFYFGRMLARMATRIVSEIMERVGTDPILVKFGTNLLYSTILFCRPRDWQ